jgi:hypothetical protein
MGQKTQSLQQVERDEPECRYIATSLYELIETINEELQPGEEELLGRIVIDLAEDQRIQFVKAYKGRIFVSQRSTDVSEGVFSDI